MSGPLLILVTLGTRGDALPFVDLARRLRRRGRRVLLLSNGDHRLLAERGGVDSRQVAPPERPQVGGDFDAFFREELMPAHARIASEIVALSEAGEDLVVVSRFGGWGAAFACERHQLPLVNILLQPDAVWPQGQPVSPEHLPLVNRFRRDLGLASIHGEGVREPALAVLSLFPDWYGWPEAAAPAAGRCVGFPFADALDAPLAPDLDAWISRHGPPVVFALGTGLVDVGAFVDASLRLHGGGSRPVLVLSGAEPPRVDPPGWRMEAFASHARLFPRASVVVHNGGVGVAAQALRAAVPQVVVPLVWDQPDNAARLEALGCAVVVPEPDARSPALEAAVRAASCVDPALLRMLAAAVRPDAAETAVDQIDAVRPGPRTATTPWIAARRGGA